MVTLAAKGSNLEKPGLPYDEIGIGAVAYAGGRGLRHGAAAGTTVPAFTGDVRFALRQIARAPLLSGIVIVVIALGIGINAGPAAQFH